MSTGVIGAGPEWQRKKAALTAGELLLRLSPPAFDMRHTIPKGATIEKTPPERWWRSNSPVVDRDDPPDHPQPASQVLENGSLSSTRGVLGFGRRTGACRYQSQYQVGSAPSAQFRLHAEQPKTVSGYSGHIPGKYAGNVIGGTYNKTLVDAEEYLKTTPQTDVYGPRATPRSTLFSPRSTRYPSPRTPRAITR